MVTWASSLARPTVRARKKYIPRGERKHLVRETLTPRQTSICKLLTSGASNKEMAQDLKISESTIKTYMSDLAFRLGLKTRLQVAMWWRDRHVTFRTSDIATGEVKRGCFE